MTREATEMELRVADAITRSSAAMNAKRFAIPRGRRTERYEDFEIRRNQANARAAIQAMREPTDEMTANVFREIRVGGLVFIPGTPPQQS